MARQVICEGIYGAPQGHLWAPAAFRKTCGRAVCRGRIPVGIYTRHGLDRPLSPSRLETCSTSGHILVTGLRPVTHCKAGSACCWRTFHRLLA